MKDISRMLLINIGREDKTEANVLHLVKYSSAGGMNHDGI